ncbi:ABC transporter ATP-binding protein [Halanaerobiaceae bacterium Z-7014]|uniref:ABC transporter ATP-binding protein n=1 Tax=Halonatronomonas betaini TaxID=2778430 RepID=A0A931ARM8_9FIRM|nr:ABC transporter ATP-binding protein [Halonatronomonas betaini]MBF8437237.1 ABC transporter ATP-binding protein [Halonatronomonas betaini]
MLKLDNISAYYGNINALSNINLEVEKGEIVSLLGANGAGKSSTLKVISGLLEPRDGDVYFKDDKITGMEPEKIVDHGIIHIPEGRQIFPTLTVAENLKIGAYRIRKSTNWQNKLDDIFEYFPVLSDRKEQQGGTLSGGEQQMLAIARGLMAEPELLMLDEPSLGLAPLIVKDIFKIIKKINSEGVTILLVEQNANMALKIANRAYILETGEIVHSGNAEDLASDEKVKEAYLGSKH